MYIDAIVNAVIPEIRNAKNSNQVKQIINSKYFSITNSSDKIRFLEKLSSKIPRTEKQQNDQALENFRTAQELINQLLGKQ